MNKIVLKLNTNQDLHIFTTNLSIFKEKLLKLSRLNQVLTMSQFDQFEEANKKTMNEILIKYSFWQTHGKLSDEEFKTFVKMKILLDELKSIKEYYEIIKNLKETLPIDPYYKSLRLKEFEEFGVNLPTEKKEELLKINQKLIHFKSKFEKNRQMAISNFNVQLTLEQFNLLPKELKQFFSSDTFEMKYSTFGVNQILSSCAQEQIRKMIWDENEKIANIGTEFNNENNIRLIVYFENKKSKILGFRSAGEQELSKSMAQNHIQAKNFLEKMSELLWPIAKKENADLEIFAKTKLNINKIERHSRNYVINKMKETLFDYRQDEERKYCSIDNVLNACFTLIDEMYGVKFKKIEPIFDCDLGENLFYFEAYCGEEKRGNVILDLFDRKDKKLGASVISYIPQTLNQNGLQKLNANFSITQEGLSFEEIKTLLHEFGHLVHNVVGETPYGYISGTRILPSDASEIPSMTLEKFAYDVDFLTKVSNGLMPRSLIEKNIKMKNFMLANFYTRQIGLSMYDLQIYNEEVDPITSYEKNMNKAMQTKELVVNSNTLMTFTHIFTLDYKSGYYGYLWSEIYAADIFDTLKADPKNFGKKYKDRVLSKGGSCQPKDLYDQLLGKEVDFRKFKNYLCGSEEKKISLKKILNLTFATFKRNM